MKEFKTLDNETIPDPEPMKDTLDLMNSPRVTMNSFNDISKLSPIRQSSVDPENPLIFTLQQKIFNLKPSIRDLESHYCENPDMIIEEFERWKYLGPINALDLGEPPSNPIKESVRDIKGGLKYYHGQVNPTTGQEEGLGR